MTRTIEIKFLAKPLNADTFKISILFSGAQAAFTIFPQYVTPVSDTDTPEGMIPIGTTIENTVYFTKLHLNSGYMHPAVSYVSQGNSIYVNISDEGNFAIQELAGAAGRITVTDVTAAIVFEGNFNAAALRKAYNNDIFSFRAGDTLEPHYATVTGPGFSIRLFPDPLNTFTVNLKPYITAAINTENFEDTLEPSLSSALPSSFIYPANKGSYLEADIDFTVHTAGLSAAARHNLAWFAGVEQPGYTNTYSRQELYVLTPYLTDTANTYALKYWQGYPFDFTVFCPALTIRLKNMDNLLAHTFDAEEKMSRIVLSDGRTDETLEELLPLATGSNTIRLSPQGQETETDKFLLMDKVPFTGGVYLKWFNALGGYSYWLFENTYATDRSTKQLGEADRDFANVEATQARTAQLGKSSQDTMKILAEMLQPHERDVVAGLLDSPKIYLYTGKPFSRAEPGSWVEVSLKTTGARLKNARQPLTSFAFDIELPERYTQTL